jgi:site-specific DNA-adenine methylase
MKYLGAKHLIGNYISTFMHDIVDPSMVDGYFEPFCGSLGVFKQVIPYKYKKYIASDLQPDIIQMWKKLQKNELYLPTTFSEKRWKELKHSPSPDALKAVAGFGMSFGGQYFSGYIQKHAGNSNRDFYKEFKNSLKKIQTLIQKPNIKFYNKSYTDWEPVNMLIYCDPPYKNTVGYDTGEFNHDEFWEVMRKWSKKNYVFISEENAPKDFKVVWKKKKKRTINAIVRDVKIEKIYIYKHGLVLSNMTKNNKTRKKSKKN